MPALQLKRFIIPIWLSIGIVVVIGLIAWLAIIIGSSKPLPETEVEKSLIPTEIMRARAAPVTSLIGTVVSIKADVMVLAATTARNPHLQEDASYRIGVSDETKVAISHVPKTIPPDITDPGSLYRSVLGTIRDIKIGDMVNVRMGGEVRGMEQLAAESIEVTKVKP